MAVEIPVIVDIEGAFQDAAKRAAKTMQPLQDALSSKTLKLNIPGIGTLKDIFKSTTISVDDLTEAMAHVKSQMELLNVRGGFLRGGKMTKEAQQLTAAYAALEAKLKGGANAVEQAINGTLRLGNATNKTTNALKAQIPILGQITASLGAYMSVHSLLRFAKQIRDVTGELEYQRVALQHLLQDEQYGAELFERIKAAAVESPFRIKDLVTYTKQLAAYRIETVKLFDTTKRLADISAGLGVDMNRLILAYGQVRAAGVLRGQELRQFTEAGIPLVELLADKFTELEGRLVSTGDVFKRISERAVPFAMISDIFEDLTDKGGMFFEMQQRQAKTLQGRWEKLKDQYDIALQSIGDSTTFQRWFDEILFILNVFAKNLRIIPKLLTAVTRGWLAYSAATLIAGKSTTKAAIAQAKLTLAERKQLKQLPALTVKILGQATATKIATKAMIGQRAATTALGRAFWKLTAAMLANPVGAIAAAFAGLATIFFSFRKKTNEVNKEMQALDETIEGAGQTLSSNRRMDTLIDRYGRLAQKSNRTAKENQLLSQTMMTLQSRFSNFKLSLDGTNKSIPEQVAKLKELNKQQREQAEALLKTAKANIELELSKKVPKQQALSARYIQQSQDRQIYLDKPVDERSRKDRKAIKTYNKLISKTDKELEGVNEEVNALYRRLTSIDELLNPTSPDNPVDVTGDRLRKLREGISDITNAYKKYIELLRYESKKSALKDIGILFPSLKGQEPSYEYVTKTFRNLVEKYRKDPEATRLIEQAFANFRFDKIKDDLEKQLKKLSNDIKRSETARNFYNEMLGLTGDEQLSATLTMSVYGQTGEEFKDRVQKEMFGALESVKNLMDEDFFNEMIGDVTIFDVRHIREQVEKLPEAIRPTFERLLSESEKYNADWLIDFQKTYGKAMDYQERIDTLNRQRRQKKVEAVSQGKSQSDIAAIDAYYNKRIAEVEVEALKNTDEWIKSFEDLNKVGTSTLESLVKLIRDVVEKSGADMEPEALRTLMRNLEQVEEQIYQRNPFKAMADGIKSYADALTGAARARRALKQEEDPEVRKKLKLSEDQQLTALDEMQSAVNGLSSAFSNLGSLVSSVGELLNFDELSDGEAILAGLSDGIQLLGVALGAVSAILTAMAANPIVLGITAAIAAIASVGKIIRNLKVSKLNREIKSQEELLEGLSYSYNRLENAIKDAFGSDYVYNYNRQLENLAAQQAAYEEQARLEREKGKKADEDKIRGYEDAARDTADKISEMRGQLAEFFSGTDLTSAAKDFASAWIDAYKQFGSMTDAMKEKFQDMIESMVTQSLAAKLMQEILDPLFRDIDKLAGDAEGLTASDIAEISRKAPEYYAQINAAMTQLMAKLGAAGVNIRDNVGSFTGISRNIATASEESINGLAAGINTQNFYMQHIDMNVALILSALTGGTSAAGGSVTGEAVDPYKDQMLQYVSYVPSIDTNLALLLTEVRKVIKPKGTPANHYVATNL